MKKMISIMLVVMVLLSTAACGAKEEQAPEPAAAESETPEKEAETGEEETPAVTGEANIYLLPKSTTSNYWRTVIAGAEAAADELGIEITILAPTEETADGQVTCVQQAVNAGATAIVLAPIDADALINACKEAKEAGVYVALVDSKINSEDYDVAYATDNYQAGVLAAESMAEAIGKAGQVYIQNSVASSSTCVDREAGFVDTMKEKYPDIEVLGTVFSNNDSLTATNQTADILTANPELAGIYSCNANTGTGVGTSVKESGKDVKIVSIDSNSDLIAFLEEKVVTNLVLQSPYAMGYEGVKGGYALSNGETLEHGIVDTGVTIASYDNKDTEEVQALFYPLGKDN